MEGGLNREVFSQVTMGPGLPPDQRGRHYRIIVGNNPVNFTDPLGLYGRDVHYDLTRQLAIEAGLNDCADTIAAADQDVDDNPATDPWLSKSNRELWHFPTAARVAEVVSIAMQSCKPQDLGRALHVVQDAYSHQGYPAWRGHLPKKSVDDPKTDPAKTQRMSAATTSTLQQFKNKCTSICCSK